MRWLTRLVCYIKGASQFGDDEQTFRAGECSLKGGIGGRVRYFNGASRLDVVAEVTRKGSAQF